MDGFDFTFDDFDDDEDYDSTSDQEKLVVDKKVAKSLEPDAEMLPAYFDKVKPPGVDHMEMTRSKENTFQVKPTNKKSVTVKEPKNSRNDDLATFDRFKYSLFSA